MPTVRRDEIDITYEVSGSGPPVVLTHSFLCSGDMWTHQVPALAPRYQVINVDNRGRGRSGPSAKPFTLYDMVADVVTVLDEVGVARAVWVGLSIGGMLSMRAALVVPERVRALVLADTDAGRETPWKHLKYRVLGWMLRTLGPAPVVPQVTAIMFGRTTRHRQPGLVAEYGRRFAGVHVPSVSAGIGALVGRDDVLPRLRQVGVPTLVMVGAEDRPLPVKLSRSIADAIPNAELVVLDGAGHLSALEQPAAFNEALLGFLARVHGSPSVVETAPPREPRRGSQDATR